MKTDHFIADFERKLKLQQYSASSIRNYCSSARIFLQVASKKFSHPNELGENEIEWYVFWKIEKIRLGVHINA